MTTVDSTKKIYALKLTPTSMLTAIEPYNLMFTQEGASLFKRFEGEFKLWTSDCLNGTVVYVDEHDPSKRFAVG